jgi:hypothetical protein
MQRNFMRKINFPLAGTVKKAFWQTYIAAV